MFARRDLIVALGPHLFGRAPAQLDRVLDTVRADRELVPLVGVAGAREQPYALASVLAVEAAIARTFAEAAIDRAGPAVPAALVAEAIAGREEQLGGPLTDGQAAAVAGICTSGRRAELVLGVAGSGKTTALAAVRDAFEAAGYEVLGTSTSGQAARTLGREAGISDSRTIASLTWRLEHGRMRLGPRSILIVDEAGITGASDLSGV